MYISLSFLEVAIEIHKYLDLSWKASKALAKYLFDLEEKTGQEIVFNITALNHEFYEYTLDSALRCYLSKEQKEKLESHINMIKYNLFPKDDEHANDSSGTSHKFNLASFEKAFRPLEIDIKRQALQEHLSKENRICIFFKGGVLISSYRFHLKTW